MGGAVTAHSLPPGSRFYEKLDLDDLKSQLFSELAIKQRVRKCDLRSVGHYFY